MTVFDLALRSMRQNVKHYYLYFFALIFSMSLFFVFSSLKYDQQVQNMLDSSVNITTAFQSAAVLLVVIIGIFAVSSNTIFLRRRSREIGLYQLIGLSKAWIIRYLLIENILLGLSALIAGILSGALVSRLFVLILMKLLNLDGLPSIHFSAPAALETAAVFMLIIFITSIQMIVMINRRTLLGLFQADKQPDLVSKRPSIFTAIIAVLGIIMIGYGYELSGRMIDEQLAVNALLVMASTITGTYILFRVTIRWCLYWFRKRKNGHIGLYNSLSLAPLMHRMKGNANSLTLITVLSALTLTLVTMAYSLYYSVEQVTRDEYPYDFAMENNELDTAAFRAELESKGIHYNHHIIDTFRANGVVLDPLTASGYREGIILWLPAEQLQQSGRDIPVPDYGEAVEYNASALSLYDDIDLSKRYPTMIELRSNKQTKSYPLNEIFLENIVNPGTSGRQIVVSEATLEEVERRMSGTDGFERVQIDTFQVPDLKELALASPLYQKYKTDDFYSADYYSRYRSLLEQSGLLIFIAAFLGLAFLASTGSILYFKQMSEAEQEKQSFRTLRQLGFDEKMIMKGVLRKQMLVFLLPLFIGILHSIYAVKASYFITLSDDTIPAMIAMGAYAAIYFMFAFFTLGYYKKIVKNAML
ncbi:cell division protein FtsX [Paenibacillus sp. FSL R7-0273]|uniref:ABC transporter permease n=1 Tax=Paenibacillus sp. FSL R7-0273 TaxID=1536772 RepID=UPI0004F5DC05|nr:ABC transporter permease [Paenibacillus sp. FSL R7-0273]AIQ48500.1 cell division protein FtsX [Paenibacillus sp. FSL R7-0273]OMF86286.1 cell division protein FtsX [Paenibacillus sp. FSL R7-0273]